MIYKRADREGHLKDFNSVPFMGNEVHWTGWNAQFLILGKRSEERGDTGVKSGEGVMVRRPRYNIEDYGEDDEEVDQDGFNPWAFFDLEAQIQNELIWKSNEAKFFLLNWGFFIASLKEKKIDKNQINIWRHIVGTRLSYQTENWRTKDKKTWQINILNKTNDWRFLIKRRQKTSRKWHRTRLWVICKVDFMDLK